MCKRANKKIKNEIGKKKLKKKEEEKPLIL